MKTESQVGAFSGWVMLSLAALPTAALAASPQDIEALLREFDANPAKVMNQRIVKRDSSGRPVATRSAFSQESIRTRKFVRDRDRYRQQICTTQGGARVCLGNVQPGRAPYAGNDLAENLVDNGAKMLRTLEGMEAKGLTEAELPVQPWSDDYWGLYKGVLAARYADASFPASDDWKVNKEYSEKFAVSTFLGNVKLVDDLSPAEKYDLLVGDQNGTLTAAMWREGKQYYDEKGSVEKWMGICHGWSPAAFMVPRPAKAISVMAADGKTKINFYPSDLKGLASLLWASTETSSRFIGGRCNDANPKTDANGRITSADCADTNAGSWHQAVVNQIGVAKRSFVIDATYDYEVWNQPVTSYRYTYFNPQTGKAVKTLDAAKVALKSYTKDKFKKYRSKKAVDVVGIAMTVRYIVETQPSHAKTDSAAADAVTSADYMYDIELDANGKIIGGEWYQNAHPDFLWTPAKDARAQSVADRFATGTWTGKTAMPESWSKAAIRAAQSGQPLAAIVETLVELSH